jgi:hypothetical protein
MEYDADKADKTGEQNNRLFGFSASSARQASLAHRLVGSKEISVDSFILQKMGETLKKKIPPCSFS